MKKRSEKQQDLDKLKTELARVSTVILSTFQGITVEDDTKLRRAVQAAGGKYKVVKNNIAEIASEGTPSEPVMKGLKGMTSLAFTDDPVALAKVLTTYAKTNPAFTFKAGLVEGRAIDIRAINDLANMPSKDEIFAKLLYVINAPAQQLVTVMNAVGRNLAVVVDQGVKENKFQG